MTKISIAIPAYNAELCLRETLESALKQTCPAHEILLVDDGSTDGTEQIARSFGDRIRYIRQKNQGVSAARNTAIREATGDWIAFLDSDDLIVPDKLEKQTAAIEANPKLVVVYSAFTYLYSDGSTYGMPAFHAADLWPAIRYRTPILPSTSVIRLSALEEVGGFSTSYHHAEDWELWFRLVRRYTPEGFQEVQESLVFYRCWENNATKDFLRSAAACIQLLDMVLLEGLRGWNRRIWRRKIEARIWYHASLRFREVQSERYWEYAVESMLRWPFFGDVTPFYRYVVFAHMLLTRVRGFRFNFRYWWPLRRCKEDLRDLV
jgi:glycosyltransferase involved in cell wall biosynthesis